MRYLRDQTRPILDTVAAPTPSAPADIRYELAGQSHTLDDYLARNPVTGLLIAVDDTILFERYQYGRGPADRMLSQSMGKTFTAMLVGIAISEGAIRSVDDRAEDYVPEIRGTEHGRTTLRDLLHMASGSGSPRTTAAATTTSSSRPRCCSVTRSAR